MKWQPEPEPAKSSFSAPVVRLAYISSVKHHNVYHSIRACAALTRAIPMVTRRIALVSETSLVPVADLVRVSAAFKSK